MIERDSFLTETEAVERADKAMDYAKHHGKNCIATYRGERFGDDDLALLSELKPDGPN